MSYSQLRGQLEKARLEYRQTAYPGDLAADVLPHRAWAWWIAAGSAIAAAVLLAVWLLVQPAQRPTEIAREPAAPTTQAEATTLTLIPSSEGVPSLTDVAEGLSLVPMAQSLAFPGTPSLDQHDDSDNSVQPTTTEAT